MCFGSINHGMINRFGGNYFSLFLLLIIYIKFDGVVLVEHNNFMIRFFKNSNNGVAHGISGTINVDLIDGFAILKSKILGQGTCFFTAKD